MQQRGQTTLKEKLVQHYQTRDFRPRPASASKAGLLTTGLMIFSIVLEAVFFLLPGLYGGGGEKQQARNGLFGEGYWTCLAVVNFTWVELTWFWWRTYMDVANYVRKSTKENLFGQMLETPPGWKTCPTCQMDAPPRSYHCNLCGRCILKRDHHCFFTGSCIGFYNQRHFVMFCIYIIWGCTLALYLQLSYTNEHLPLVNNFYTYFAPVTFVQLLLGNLEMWAFLVLFHANLTVFFMFTAAVFLMWQLLIITRGQTSYEAWKDIHIYDEGLCKNVTSVFGSPLNSCILLFAPLMLPLEGDGCRWSVRAKSEKGH